MKHGLNPGSEKGPISPVLGDGARIGIIGGGPAGSFFSYFLLSMAERIDQKVLIDIYEPRDFSLTAPAGCNMCGGIVSESLVQALAVEDIELPSSVLRKGIDSYILHMDVGSVRIDTPLQEMRIGAVYRGGGPKGEKMVDRIGFDGFLQDLVVNKGASMIRDRVVGVEWNDGYPEIKLRNGSSQTYDLLVVAAGINTSVLKLFQWEDFQ